MGFFASIWRRLRWSPSREGRAGEEAAEQVLRRMGRRKGLVLRNVYIPRGDGGTAEADLLWVTARGVFVLEVKNYAGRIVGRESGRTWQRLRFSGRDAWGRQQVDRMDFYNPIWQNRSHCRALERYLSDWAVPVVPVVVFSDRCDLSGIQLDSDVVVCPLGRLKKRLKRARRRLPRALFRRQVKALYRELETLEGDGETRRQHRRQVVRERETAAVCPRCGAELVLRTVRHGPNRGRSFYGCKRYPWCRYMREC